MFFTQGGLLSLFISAIMLDGIAALRGLEEDRTHVDAELRAIELIFSHVLPSFGYG